MVHLAIDDHSRVSFAQVLPDGRAVSCVQFLRQAVKFYAGLGAPANTDTRTLTCPSDTDLTAPGKCTAMAPLFGAPAVSPRFKNCSAVLPAF